MVARKTRRQVTVTHEADEIRFTIVYDGPAVANGRMPLFDIAPAMLSTAQLVEDGIRFLYGNDAALTIEVNADFRRGSFAFEVFTSPDTLHHAQGLIAALTPQQLDLGLKLLGIGGSGGLIGFIKWLRGRTIQRIDKQGDQAVVTVRDGNNITINASVVNLALNNNNRRDADGVVAPLRSPGIEEFRAQLPGAPATVVEKMR